MSGHGSSLNERISHRPSVWQMRLVRAENGASGASVSKIWLNKLKLLPPGWWICFCIKCCHCVCHPTVVLSNVLQWSGPNGQPQTTPSARAGYKYLDERSCPAAEGSCGNRYAKVSTFSHLEEVESHVPESHFVQSSRLGYMVGNLQGRISGDRQIND